MARRPQSALSPEDRAVLVAMANFDLKPGQMLLIGPRSARLLIGLDGGFQGKLPDKLLLDEHEWKLQSDDKRNK